MKKMIIVLLAFIGIGMCMTTVTYYSASSLTFMGDHYCRTIAMSHYKKSFYILSDGFQKDVMLWEYKEYIKKSPLQRYRSADWAYRRQDDKTGMIRGVIKTEEGGHANIEMFFVYENKRWKIDQLIIDRHPVREELNALKRSKEHGTVPKVS